MDCLLLCKLVWSRGSRLQLNAFEADGSGFDSLMDQLFFLTFFFFPLLFVLLICYFSFFHFHYLFSFSFLFLSRLFCCFLSILYLIFCFSFLCIEKFPLRICVKEFEIIFSFLALLHYYYYYYY